MRLVELGRRHRRRRSVVWIWPWASIESTSQPSSRLVHTGTLAFFRPRPTQPVTPLAGSCSALAAATISSKVGRIGDALGLEQLLVAVEQVVVDVDRQGVDPAVGLRRPEQARPGRSRRSRSRATVIAGSSSIGRRSTSHLPLATSRFCTCSASISDVEGGGARGELDHRLLPLLLLRHLLRADLDAGHLGELALVLLQQVAARALGQQHLDLLAREALPVEAALGACARRTM